MNNISTPFDSIDVPTQPVHAEPGALEVLERAQIDIQISTAKRYPRNIAKVKSDIMAFATLDEETATSCFYTIPRGDKMIQGASVRLAEIALSCWGNIRAATRIVATVTDGPTPHVVVQSAVFDLEKNTSVLLEKRRRITKKKSKAQPDEDDIGLATNACSAIALRDAVLKVVPRALITPALAAAMKVAVGEVKSLVAKRASVISRLKQMGVTEDRILAAIECTSVDAIDAEKLATLIGLGTAIKEGATSIEDAFPLVAKKPAFEKRTEPEITLSDEIPMGGSLDPLAPRQEPVPPPPPRPAVRVMPQPEAAESGEEPELSAEHHELAKLLDDKGIGFAKLQSWAVKKNWEPGWDSYTSLNEVPRKSVARLLKARAGLILELGK